MIGLIAHVKWRVKAESVRHSPHLPILSPHRAFTLVELLVTITIIGMLAGMSLAALHRVHQAARIDGTRATIAKIDAYVMHIFESYRTRRLMYRFYSDAAATTEIGIGTVPANVRSRARLDALRELMRIEMPERFEDRNRYIHPYTTGGNTYYMRIEQSAISRAYNRRYNAHTPANSDYESAKSLYWFVMAHFPDAREHFNDAEIGRPHNDGWPVFLDAWGNPIAFLRWAPAFNDSDIQRNVYNNASSAYNTSYVTEAITNDHDPFDPSRLDGYCWRLLPLIYSAGPDGIYDIHTDVGHTYAGSPYGSWVSGNFVYYTIGNPADEANTSITAPSTAGNGSLDHFDNIHNHRTEVK